MLSRSRSCSATPPLEEQGEQRVVDGLAQVHRVPALIASHPEDAVPDVVVVAEDVGELVVDVVVRVLPLLGRLRGVPLPVAGVDLRVVHPVPLAVHDVVADLHVLQDLRHTQHERPGHPRRRVLAREQRDPACCRKPALDRDHLVDVRRVRRSSRLLDLLPQGVELTPELFHLLVGEVDVLLYVGDRHGGSLLLGVAAVSGG